MSDEVDEFFLFYEENNGFPYNPSHDPLHDFKKLAKYMNWGQRAAARHKNELKELLNNYENYEEDYNCEEDGDYFEYEDEEEYNSDNYYEDDDYDINNFNNVHEYFEYFKNSYNFRYDSYENAKITFKKLAKFMKWSKKSFYERNEFYRLESKQEKKEYLRRKQEKYGWVYQQNRNISLDNHFEDLCEYMGWDQYEKKEREFDDLVSFQVENVSENVETLRKTIIFYGIHRMLDEMPSTLTQCKKVMKKYLFVNIYDYVVGNKKKFEDLQSLRRYTFENDLFYKKEEAKKHLVKKILLRKMFRNN